VADFKALLDSLSPEQKQSLGIPYQDVVMGQEPVPMPAALPPTGNASQDAIGRQMQLDAMPDQTLRDSNLAMAQQAPEAYNAMNASLVGAGAAPAELPVPLQPGLPARPIQAAPEQVMAEVQAATQADAQRKAASVMAVKQAADEQEKANRIAQQDQADTEKVEADSKDYSWGSKISQALAIMMGAYSQGLTGAKENPAIVAIDKELERQAQQRKYSEEQKIKLQEMAYRQAQQKIEEQKAKTDSMLAWKKLEQADQDIAIKLQELGMKQQERQVLTKSRFSQDEVRALPSKQREELNLVRLPDGSYASALGSEDAKKLRTEVLPATDNALRALKELKILNEKWGNNPLAKLTDREGRGRAQSLAQEIVGSIRLEYFGPGVLTDNEQDIARSIIGSPQAYMSLSGANKAKLDTMIDKMKFSRRIKLRESGIDMPLSRNEKMLQQAEQKYPNAQRGDLINALMKQGKWDYNEE
jgi:hypothetical protein